MMDSVFLVSLLVNVLLAATAAQGFVLKSGSEGILWSNDPHCGEVEHKDFSNVKLIARDGQTVVAYAALVDDRHVVTAASVDLGGGEVAFAQLGSEVVPVLPELSSPIGEFLRLVPLERPAADGKAVCLPERDEADSISLVDIAACQPDGERLAMCVQAHSTAEGCAAGAVSGVPHFSFSAGAASRKRTLVGMVIRAECEPAPGGDGGGFLVRRWFVDPLTSFDAGAIALAVAEGRRTRQPKQLDAADPEEIAAATERETAKKVGEELAPEIEKELTMGPEDGHVTSCPAIRRLCNTNKMRCALDKEDFATAADRKRRSASRVEFDEVSGAFLCPVESDCADPSQESGDMMIHATMAREICSRLKESMMNSGDDTVDIGDLSQFGQFGDVAESLLNIQPLLDGVILEGLDGNTGLVQESTDLLAELDGLKGLIASAGPDAEGVVRESTNLQTALDDLEGIIASGGLESLGIVQESTNLGDLGLVPESLHRGASDGPEVQGAVQDSTKARIGSDGLEGDGLVKESTESENPLKQISFDDIEASTTNDEHQRFREDCKRLRVCTVIANGLCGPRQVRHLETTDDDLSEMLRRLQGKCICDDGYKKSEGARGDAFVKECVPEESEDPDSTCTTVLKNKCQFPYRDESGQLRYECFKSKNGVERFKSFCPTKIDPLTGILDRDSIEECHSHSCPLAKYHTHPELMTELNELTDMSSDFFDNAELFNLGNSQRGAPLYGIRLMEGVSNINGSILDENELLRPKVKLIGNMHGNEPVGRELLIHLAKYLLQSRRDGDARASKILKSTDLYILPTMNPDGFDRGEEGRCSGGTYSHGRLSEGRKDLNRNFPKWHEHKKWERALREDSVIFSNREKETQLLMRWILDNLFVLSVNFHDGAVLVNYPWDNYQDKSEVQSGIYKTPDHNEFYRIATAYSYAHGTMNNTAKACPRWGLFEDGVTNGADWYPVEGGMQDFNYLYAGTMEVLVELSCCKFAHKSRLLKEWENNRESLLKFVEQVHTGIKGFVTEEDGSTPEVIDGNHIEVRAREVDGSGNWRKIWSRTMPTPMGSAYWRILNDGRYEVQAVEWTTARNSNLADFREVVRQSDVITVRVQNDVERGAQRRDLKLRRVETGQTITKFPINPRAQPVS